MPSSAHRLTRTVRRKPVEAVPPLDDLIAQYLAQRPALDRFAKTISHHQASFTFAGKYWAAQDLPPDTRVLTTSVLHDFARQLRDLHAYLPRGWSLGDPLLPDAGIGAAAPSRRREEQANQ